MAGGRPPKYKKKYCDEILAMAKDNLTQGQWWTNLGIVNSTATYWKQNHPEFLKSYEDAVEILKGNVAKTAQEMVDKGTTGPQLAALKFLAGCTLKMRENDSREEIEEAVAKQLPRFTSDKEN